MAPEETEGLHDKLDELGADIRKVKDNMPESAGGSERRKFIDDGVLDEDQPVDNTIVPPG